LRLRSPHGWQKIKVLDLRSINGSGPNGRIIKRDIEAVLSKPQAAVATASGYRDEPATQIRQTIAKRLVTSIGPVPHFFLTIDVEMDRAAEMRKNVNALDADVKISVNDIIIKVAAAALIRHPQVNARSRTNSSATTSTRTSASRSRSKTA
jgi:pyruvate dehydrogenase E2 component (dihydrolipoamide acetyltransferase)